MDSSLQVKNQIFIPDVCMVFFFFLLNADFLLEKLQLMSVSHCFMQLFRTQWGGVFQPDCAHQSGASALSDRRGVNICFVVSSCFSSCVEWISVPDPASLSARIIPHGASPPCSRQHWKSPTASSPHCWTCEPFLSVSHGVSASVKTGVLPWRQWPARNRWNCAWWWIPGGFG